MARERRLHTWLGRDNVRVYHSVFTRAQQLLDNELEVFKHTDIRHYWPIIDKTQKEKASKVEYAMTPDRGWIKYKKKTKKHKKLIIKQKMSQMVFPYLKQL